MPGEKLDLLFAMKEANESHGIVVRIERLKIPLLLPPDALEIGGREVIARGLPPGLSHPRLGLVRVGRGLCRSYSLRRPIRELGVLQSNI